MNWWSCWMSDFLDIKEMGESAVIPSPTLAIVLLTYERTDLALRTIQGICENLDYPKRSWYIADDGSSLEHVKRLVDELQSKGESLYAMHNQTFADRPFCGRGWNHALQRVHNLTNFVLWIEDDWHLDIKLDIRPYIRLLLEREDVGIVTFRGLTDGLQTEVACHNGRHYLKIMRSGTHHSMAYSGNPLIRHVRYLEYGLFSPFDTPGDIEVDCDNRYRGHIGPDIWRPADMNPWGCFGHIGNERTW